MKEITYINAWLKENLSSERFFHSQGVADAAKKLAKIYKIDENKAYLAGLIHDCAKNIDNNALLKIIKEEIKVGFVEDELQNPKIYHAIVAPYLAKKEFEIEDEEILSSIRNHTVGKLNMSLFEKIIFLADKIETNTRDENYTSQLWKIIEEDNKKGLDRAIFRCFCETIKSLVERKLFIATKTIDVYNELAKKLV